MSHPFLQVSYIQNYTGRVRDRLCILCTTASCMYSRSCCLQTNAFIPSGVYRRGLRGLEHPLSLASAPPYIILVSAFYLLCTTASCMYSRSCCLQTNAFIPSGVYRRGLRGLEHPPQPGLSTSIYYTSISLLLTLIFDDLHIR